MKWPDRPYLVWGIALCASAVLPLFAGFTSFGWELSEIAGFAAALVCIVLCGAPLRPRQSAPPALISFRRHVTLGKIALGLAALHVVLAVATDHTVVEYLKWTSPLYQLAGIVALAVLAVLVVSSRDRWRARVWRSHRGFQAVHIILGCVLVVLVTAHVVTADRYSNGYLRRSLLILSAVGLVLLLRRRRVTRSAPRESTRLRSLAFGRHSRLIAGTVIASALALTSLVIGRADVALREPLLRRTELLPLDFDHGKHVAVNCLTCHHNYADGKGFDSCIQCHRSARADLKVGVEARFHSFCLQCHRNPAPQLLHHGPVSGCVTCHQVGADQSGSGSSPLDRPRIGGSP
jgi:predicted CXXCH cytochrome family protein